LVLSGGRGHVIACVYDANGATRQHLDIGYRSLTDTIERPRGSRAPERFKPHQPSRPAPGAAGSPARRTTG